MTRSEFLAAQVSYLCTVIDEDRLEYIAAMAQAAANSSKQSAPICITDDYTNNIIKIRSHFYGADEAQVEMINKTVQRIVKG